VEPPGAPRSAQLDHRGTPTADRTGPPQGGSCTQSFVLLWAAADRPGQSGRPVSQVTTAFLAWLCERLAAEQKRVLVLLWDNASWHISQEVHAWVRAHNLKVKRHGGVRLLTWRLPIKSPWLNPIEPHWGHGKRAIVEPACLLTAAKIISCVSEYFGCEHEEHLTQLVA
jgi:transposase